MPKMMDSRAELALSVVMAKWGKEAIAERNALRAENDALPIMCMCVCGVTIC